MTRLPALLFRCLLWACLFTGSRPAEGSFQKSSATTVLASATQGYDGSGRLAGITNWASGTNHAYLYTYAANSPLLQDTEFRRQKRPAGVWRHNFQGISPKSALRGIQAAKFCKSLSSPLNLGNILE